MTRIAFEAAGAALGADLILPTGDGPHPAIILLPAIAGVNGHVRGAATRLAWGGYAVAVLDYYQREGSVPDVSTPEKIGAAVAGLSDPGTLGDIAALGNALRSRPEVDGARLAALGFCIGGMYAYLAACEDFGLRCAVNYYDAIRYGISLPGRFDRPATKLQNPLYGYAS